MSALSNISVYDGAGTPALHTLTAISLSREKDAVTAYWRENNGALPTAACLSATMSLQRLKSGVHRSELRVTVPAMESISGQNAAGYTAAPKIAYEDTFVLVGFHHDRSTLNSRRLARMILVNIANNITTSVAANVGGPLPELTDGLILPT